jgi:hypothetical protein
MPLYIGPRTVRNAGRGIQCHTCDLFHNYKETT